MIPLCYLLRHPQALEFSSRDPEPCHRQVNDWCYLLGMKLNAGKTKASYTRQKSCATDAASCVFNAETCVPERPQ